MKLPCVQVQQHLSRDDSELDESVGKRTATTSPLLTREWSAAAFHGGSNTLKFNIDQSWPRIEPHLSLRGGDRFFYRKPNEGT